MNIVRDGNLHEDLIAFLVKRLKVQNYLELGAGNGETLMKVTLDAEPTCRFTAVDRKAPAFHIPSVAFFVCETQDFLANSAPALAPFDFVLIDADHHYEAVSSDLVGVFPHVTEHGLILLHDTFPASEADTDQGLCGDAWKAADWSSDLLMSAQAEKVTIPFSPGLTIIRKRSQHLAWTPA